MQPHRAQPPKTFGYACCYRVIILFQLSSVGGR